MRTRSPTIRDRRPYLRTLLALLIAVCAGPAAADPRELSPAERHAVWLADLYLHDGPDAWWPELADGSPLHRLGRQAAAQALEVRAGPPADARWTLQTLATEEAADTAVFWIELPSGVDEILTLKLRQAGEGWKVQGVTAAAEIVAEAVPTAATASPPIVEEPETPPASTPDPKTGVAAAAVAALLLVSLLIASRRHAGCGVRLILLVAAVAAAVTAVRNLPADLDAFGRGAAPEPPASAPDVTGGDELARLLPLRRAVAVGDRRALVEARQALEPLPPTDLPGRVARLWEAQLLLVELRLNEVDELLTVFPPRQSPRAELLRARLAVLRRNEPDAVLAYQRALEVLPRHDGLLHEVARACRILGFPDRADAYYQELAELGSRQADPYYEMAERSLMNGLRTRAAEQLQTAWRLRPWRREEVLRQPVLVFLLEQRPDLLAMVDLGAVAEARVDCPRLSDRPLPIPAERAGVVGSLLTTAGVAGGRLEVPGGCRIAPSGVEVFDAGSWQERQDRQLLARFADDLTDDGAADLDLAARPELRRHLPALVEALAHHDRWSEVERLTDGVPAELLRTSPDLVQRRLTALRRAGRLVDARDLLIGIAGSDVAQRQVDPGILYQLAELLVGEGQYDLALRLMAKANAALPFEVSRQRMLQVQVEKRLATSSLVYESDHFALRYPLDRSYHFARDVADILEAERRRLQRWIPLAGGVEARRTEVYLLELDDFRASYGGGIEIAGLFDGKIRVPFGEVQTFTPPLVSILTHELAHAMIAEHTRDRAPRWFQEGLAQHVEMVSGRVNPIPGYRRTGTLIAFPVLEPVLATFNAQQLVPIAYEESQWTLHFIETRHGVRAVHGLLAAFRDGLGTRAAIERVFDRSLADFDRELWSWCVDKAPAAWTTEVVDYQPTAQGLSRKQP